MVPPSYSLYFTQLGSVHSQLGSTHSGVEPYVFLSDQELGTPYRWPCEEWDAFTVQHMTADEQRIMEADMKHHVS